MKNLYLRVVSSLIMVIALTGVHLFCSNKQQFILVSALTMVLCWEYYKLVFYKPSQLLFRWLFIFLSFIFYLSICFYCKNVPFLMLAILLIPIFALISLIFVFCFWIFVLLNKTRNRTSIQNKGEKGIITSVFMSSLSSLYIISPALFLHIYYTNPLFVLIYLCIVFSSDTFAYLGGSILGGKKWVPFISPGKTWSGLTSGLLISGLVCFFCFYLRGHKNLFWMFLFGVFIFFIAQTGDLFISLLKRRAGVKDTGVLLPGHGGLLDRLDGFLVALPIYTSVLYFIEYLSLNLSNFK